jgi:formylglycine-generating enzyme required for sulfatase activity
MKRKETWVLACVLVTLCANSAGANVVIDTVPVGNPGNVGDARYPDGGVLSFGSVPYEYNIGKYEVTAGQYCEFLNAVAATDTYGLYYTDMAYGHIGYGCRIHRSGSPGSYTYSVAADWAGRPVNYVSWGDAARFANWLHNGQPTGIQDLATTEDGSYLLDGATSEAALIAVARKPNATWVIPTEDEWYKAAYHKNDPGASGGSYWDYPTNGDTVPGYVNDSGTLSGAGTPFVEDGIDPGNYATYNGDGPGGTDGIGSPYYRTEAGEWENSGSPYGTFDQGGNLWEWNEAVFSWPVRGLRGGTFYDNDSILHASHRDSCLPQWQDFGFGFRVALVPEPATVAIFTLASMGVFWRRRCSG